MLPKRSPHPLDREQLARALDSEDTIALDSDFTISKVRDSDGLTLNGKPLSGYLLRWEQELADGQLFEVEVVIDSLDKLTNELKHATPDNPAGVLHSERFVELLKAGNIKTLVNGVGSGVVILNQQLIDGARVELDLDGGSILELSGKDIQAKLKMDTGTLILDGFIGRFDETQLNKVTISGREVKRSVGGDEQNVVPELYVSKTCEIMNCCMEGLDLRHSQFEYDDIRELRGEFNAAGKLVRTGRLAGSTYRLSLIPDDLKGVGDRLTEAQLSAVRAEMSKSLEKAQLERLIPQINARFDSIYRMYVNREGFKTITWGAFQGEAVLPIYLFMKPGHSGEEGLRFHFHIAADPTNGCAVYNNAKECKHFGVRQDILVAMVRLCRGRSWEELDVQQSRHDSLVIPSAETTTIVASTTTAVSAATAASTAAAADIKSSISGPTTKYTDLERSLVAAPFSAIEAGQRESDPDDSDWVINVRKHWGLVKVDVIGSDIASNPNSVGVYSAKGQMRSDNEDRALAFNIGARACLIIAEGCDGHKQRKRAAGIAAYAAAQNLSDSLVHVPPTEPADVEALTAQAVKAAQDALEQVKATDHSIKDGDLATSLTVVVLDGNNLGYSYLGNGGLYFRRAFNASIRALEKPMRDATGFVTASVSADRRDAPKTGSFRIEPDDLVIATTYGTTGLVPELGLFGDAVDDSRKEHGNDLQQCAQATVLDLASKKNSLGAAFIVDNVTVGVVSINSKSDAARV